MSSLFADTHNVVAILEKSDAAEGFEQIIDFLSGSYIHYALTVNPHIYISCIKQFWNTSFVKRLDDVTRLQALDDRKKIVISEDVIREILQLDDAEGVLCLPNEEIFAGLAQMGYEKPYISPALTQKVFANMRRDGKGFSGVETPLFEGMLAARQLAEEGIAEEQVQANVVVDAAVQDNVAEDVANAAIPSPPSHDIPSPSQEQYSPPQQPQSSPQVPPQCADFPTHIQQVLDVCSALTRRVENLEHDKAAQKLEIIKLKARVKRRIDSSDDIEDVFNQGRMIDDLDKDEGIELAEIYNLDMDHPSKVLSMQEDDSEVQEVVKVVTTAKLITDVVIAALQVSAASATIYAAKLSIHAVAPTVDAAIDHVNQKSKNPQYIKRYQGMKKRPQTESKARKNMMIYLTNTAGYKMDFFKGMSYAKICPIFQARFDENMRFLFKSREEMEEEDQEIIKSINETLAQKVAKRRKLSEEAQEAQEAEDLKKRLEVVDDEDDDVFIEATPLARKVKENQEKDKIGSKLDKNGKRGEAGKSLKQLQWVKEEKLNKTQKEWPKMQIQSKAIQV
nr:hypothetical protein [Tanacetum cinerariifolium]